MDRVLYGYNDINDIYDKVSESKVLLWILMDIT